MPDSSNTIDYAALLPDDPSGKTQALVNALRNQQLKAQEIAIYSGHPEKQGEMLNEQAKEGLGMIGQAEERKIKGAQALRETRALENQITEQQERMRLAEEAAKRAASHQTFEEGQARANFGLRQAEADKTLHPPVPEGEGSKLESMKASGPLIDRVEARWNKYINTPITNPIDKANAYMDYAGFLNGAISNIAAGAAPTAKDSEELMKGFHARFPTKMSVLTPEAAHTFFDSQRDAVKENLGQQVKLLKAGPYNRAQVEQLSRPLMKEPAAGQPTAPASKHPKRVIEGAPHTWNGKAWVKD